MNKGKAALTLLTRLAARRPEQSSRLQDLLHGRLDAWALTAMDVAVETGDPIGRILARLLGDAPDPSLSSRIEVRLPSNTVSLRELAVECSRQMLLDHQRRGGDERAEAGLRNDLAIRLGAVGSHEEAWQESRRVIDLAEHLLRGDGDDKQIQADLARGLHTASNRLAALGRYSDAVEYAERACTLYRRLEREDQAVYREPLDIALHSLITRRYQAGQAEAALAVAEEALARIGIRDGDSIHNRADEAALLISLANLHDQLGSRKKALAYVESAVEIYRILSDMVPDAYSATLALSLATRSNCLSACGDYAAAVVDAREAVAIRRKLATARPDAFLGDLLSAVNGLTAALGDAGRYVDAMASAKEAVEAAKGLVRQNATAFSSDLALAWNNLANIQEENGLLDDALVSIWRAVKLYRDLYREAPGFHAENLAMSLYNFGVMAGAKQDYDKALSALDESHDLYSGLAERHPRAYTADVAACLSTSAVILRDLGHLNAALSASERARAMLEPYYRAEPAAFEDSAEVMLRTHESIRRRLGISKMG